LLQNDMLYVLNYKNKIITVINKKLKAQLFIKIMSNCGAEIHWVWYNLSLSSQNLEILRVAISQLTNIKYVCMYVCIMLSKYVICIDTICDIEKIKKINCL